jgi:hypothetical protein
MRTYEEQTTLILERVNLYNSARKKAKRTIYFISNMAACFAIVVISLTLTYRLPNATDLVLNLPSLELSESPSQTQSERSISSMLMNGSWALKTPIPTTRAISPATLTPTTQPDPAIEVTQMPRPKQQEAPTATPALDPNSRHKNGPFMVTM